MNKKYILSLFLLISISCTNSSIDIDRQNPISSADYPIDIIEPGTIFYNAKILSVDYCKVGCHRGCLIKVGNDTIKTYDYKVFKIAGYEILSPILVDLEIGEHNPNCIRTKYQYYSINNISRVHY